jgi:hypothetical protein
MKINETMTYTLEEVTSLYNGSKKTFQKCADLQNDGYRFIPGNNPRMDTAKKWAGFDLVRVAQTNHRKHGKCIQTLWAVKVYAVDTKWARVTEEAFKTALSCCKGRYQESVVNGLEAISGSTLQGKAKDYIGKYRRSVGALMHRMEMAGLYVHEETEECNRRVLVIEVN